MEDCVLIEKNCQYAYAAESNEKMMKAVKREGTVDIGKTRDSVLGTKNENLENKNMNSIFFWNTEFRDEKTWSWLKKKMSEENN